MSFYVGPGVQGLRLSTWSEVESAADSGVLDESAWVEHKRDVPASSKGANRELAKDLASLSVDGGTLLIGVVDKTLDVVGVTEPFESVRTRVVQVASTVVSPPLHVDVSTVAKPNAVGAEHVVIVAVPASGNAPHMVEGHYWGRSSEGKRILDDVEVERLMGRRSSGHADFESQLRGVTRVLDSGLHPEPAHGRLFLLAAPATAPGTLLSDRLEDAYPPQVIRDSLDFKPSWSPWSLNVQRHQSHPDGILLSNDDPRRDLVVSDEFALDLLLRDDGGVLAAGRRATYSREVSGSGEDAEVITVGYVLEGVHVLSRLAGHIAADHLDNWGQHRIGVLVTGLRGCYASQRFGGMGTWDLHPYPADEYLARTSASTRELLEKPADVVSRLVKRLLRSVGVSNTFLPYQSGDQIAARNRA